MVFQKRPILQTVTLGERLRQVREESGRTTDVIGREIAVQPKYLVAIEAGDYRALPGPVYARNFVRQYATALGVDVEQVMELFDREYHITTAGTVDRHLPPERVTTEHHWLRRHSRFILAALVVAAVGTYFGLQVYRLLAPPKLIISSPPRDISTTALHLTITGQTDPTATVTINNQTASIDAQGNFRVPVDVSLGLNTIRITAVKKHSHATVVERKILVEAGAQ